MSKEKVMKGKILFKGNFWKFFFFSILLLVGCFLTFGILLPYYFYWQYKYFVSHLDIELYKS